MRVPRRLESMGIPHGKWFYALIPGGIVRWTPGGEPRVAWFRALSAAWIRSRWT